MSIPARAQRNSTAVPDLAQLEKMISRFAPTPLRVDTSKLSAGDRQALVKLIEAARILNDIFMKQLWDGNPALVCQIAEGHHSRTGQGAAALFLDQQRAVVGHRRLQIVSAGSAATQAARERISIQTT